MKRGELMSSLFEKRTVWMDRNCNTKNMETFALKPVLECQMNRLEVRVMMEEEHMIQTNKLKARVAQVTKESLIETIENIDFDH